jgi:hypothetical protein
LVVEVRYEVGSRSGPFIGAGRFGSVEIFELQELRWPSMAVGGNILALTHR